MKHSSRNENDVHLDTIERGFGIDQKFWENFLQILHDSKGLSELLDVPERKVKDWHSRILEAVDRREKQLQNQPIKKNNKLIK